MKYFFCKLHGPRPTFMQDMTAAERQVMLDHGAYLKSFAEAGTAIAFGPVADPAGGYGIGLWELLDDAKIEVICAADPAVKSGLGFRYDIQPMPRVVTRK